MRLGLLTLAFVVALSKAHDSDSFSGEEEEAEDEDSEDDKLLPVAEAVKEARDQENRKHKNTFSHLKKAIIEMHRQVAFRIKARFRAGPGRPGERLPIVMLPPRRAEAEVGPDEEIGPADAPAGAGDAGAPRAGQLEPGQPLPEEPGVPGGEETTSLEPYGDAGYPDDRNAF